MKQQQTRPIGEMLLRYRQHTGLTMRRLATITGISAATLCRLENGTTVPDFDATLKLLNWMFGRANA